MGDTRGSYRVSVARYLGKRSFEKRRRKWIRLETDLQEVGWGGKDWVDLFQHRDRWWALVNAVTNLRAP
jgi:hypothetical protein